MGETRFSNLGCYIHTTPGWKLKKVKRVFDDYLKEIDKMPEEYQALLMDGIEILSQAMINDERSDRPKEEVDEFVYTAIGEILSK